MCHRTRWHLKEEATFAVHLRLNCRSFSAFARHTCTFMHIIKLQPRPYNEFEQRMKTENELVPLEMTDEEAIIQDG